MLLNMVKLSKYFQELGLYKISKFLFIFLAICISIFPIYWMLSLSFRTQNEFLDTINFIPQTFTLLNFIHLFSEYEFMTNIINSLFVTTISVSISLLIGIPAAYVLSSKEFGVKFITSFLVLVLLIRIIPPITLAIPLFTFMNELGITSTRLPIILAHILVCLPFLIWYMCIAFHKVPTELTQSAKIDGASNWQIFIQINLALVKTNIIVTTIFSFVASWNEYLFSMIFTQDPANFTVPIALTTFNSEDELTQWGMLASGGIVSTLPIGLFMILLQKFMIRDLSSGAIKG